MINFFRKIRYSLIRSSNTTPYIKYAIGEIFLVVLGILIAVQINTWNENRNKFNSAKDFVADFKFDIEQDTTVFGAQLRKINGIIQYHKWLLNTTDYDEVPLEYIEGISKLGYHNVKINNGTFV